jgi:hypothetical protein
MKPTMAILQLCVSLLLGLPGAAGLAPQAPYDTPGLRTSSSLSVRFLADEDTVGGAVESYELSRR